jgi:hypothetical protein
VTGVQTCALPICQNEILRYYENVSSNWDKVQHGIPQGSVHGLLLFLLYINDLPLNFNPISTHILFTDDTSVLIAEPDVRQVAESSDHIFTVLNK